MLLPIEWLKKYVAVNESDEQVAERFVGLGFETEECANGILDLEITPNRGDVLSMIGLAREYAAATQQSLAFPQKVSLPIVDNWDEFTVVADPKAFHRISAVIIRNVSTAASPDWLKQAVESVGMNSINTIVDLTNFVMFELGIPMHAFDLDRLPAREFKVRLSRKGEEFISLKNERCELPDNSIVVESKEELVDLLGIRGGKSSMIQPDTKNILVWAVSVPRPLIRHTSKTLSLRTEGSYRHERETDWEMVPVAIERFVQLVNELGGGDSSAMLDLVAEPRQPKQIAFDRDWINSLLGSALSEEEMADGLVRLGFTIADKTVVVPSWRYFDINYPEDIAEEVARIYGYNKLPRKIVEKAERSGHSRWAAIEALKDSIAGTGFSEVYTESFSGRSEGEILEWHVGNLAVLANPVNRDYAYCRPSIVPNLIKILALNSWSDDAKIFEVGNVFPAKEIEQTNIALAAYGKQQKLFSQWISDERIEYITAEHPLAQLYKLRRPITIAEVPVDSIVDLSVAHFTVPSAKPTYRPVSSYPPAVRDISMIIDSNVDQSQLVREIKDISPESIVLVELFDQFTTDRFGPNRQSLAYHIVYQSVAKTLDTREVELLHQKVLMLLTQKYAAEIR